MGNFIYATFLSPLQNAYRLMGFMMDCLSIDLNFVNRTIHNYILIPSRMWQFFEDFTCGTIAGIIGCLSSYSLDTIKVHMQVESKYGMMRTIANIVEKQGIMQLFSGIYYPLVTAPIISAMSFSSYELYKTIRQKQQLSYLDGFQSGMFAGLIITFVVSPVELVKCTMQMNPNHTFKNSRECLNSIYRSNGLRGVYKGIFPTAMRQIPSFGFQFATYEYLKDAFIGKQKTHLSISELLCVGPIAAMCSELFTYPQDIIKTNIQLNPAGTYKRSKWFPDEGFAGCAKHIWKTKGPQGFIRGLKPCLLRAILGDGIGIVIYEKSQEFIAHLKKQ